MDSKTDCGQSVAGNGGLCMSDNAQTTLQKVTLLRYRIAL